MATTGQPNKLAPPYRSKHQADGTANALKASAAKKKAAMPKANSPVSAAHAPAGKIASQTTAQNTKRMKQGARPNISRGGK